MALEGTNGYVLQTAWYIFSGSGEARAGWTLGFTLDRVDRQLFPSIATI